MDCVLLVRCSGVSIMYCKMSLHYICYRLDLAFTLSAGIQGWADRTIKFVATGNGMG